MSALGAAVVLSGLPAVAPSTSPTEAAPTAATATAPPAQQPDAPSARPNIVLITTDDMRADDLRWMPQTRRLLGRAGVTMSDFLSSHPLCCPARAQIMTGQHAQNNGVLTNKRPNGGYPSLRDPGNNVGSWLQAAGYRTAFIGKHMNFWDGRRQGGWTHFNPIVRNVYAPRGLVMYNDGHRQRYSRVYGTDLLSNLSVREIRRLSGAAPFFVWTSYVAPHGMLVKGTWVPPVPAKRHQRLFASAKPPAMGTPAFNEAHRADKPRWVRRQDQRPAKMRGLHRARIQSLQAVDEGVAATIRALRRAGELSSTVIVFSSDNGFLLGEHGLRDKNVAYEESLRVPLVVRGPGIPAGVVRRGVFGLVDLPATIADLAGARPTRVLDGRSMLPHLRQGAKGYDTYLIQAGAEGRKPAERWWWRGVRSPRYTYVRYDDGTEELYDLRRDPAQLRNMASRPSYSAVLGRLSDRLDVLADCSGRDCVS